MHEYNITKEIIDIVLDKLNETQSGKIKTINISMGKLTSFVPESIEYYYPFISKGTKAEEARLKFKMIDIIYHCKKCNKKFRKGQYAYFCPKCKNDNPVIVSGNEFYIESIEVEDEKN